MKLTYIEKLSDSKALNKYRGCLVINVCGTAVLAEQGKAGVWLCWHWMQKWGRRQCGNQEVARADGFYPVAMKRSPISHCLAQLSRVLLTLLQSSTALENSLTPENPFLNGQVTAETGQQVLCQGIRVSSMS